MEDVVAKAFSWSLLEMGIIWFVVGAFLAWRKGIGASIYLPLIVAALPAVVAVGARGTGVMPAAQISPGLTVLAVVVSVGCSVLGGRVALAIDPDRYRVREIRAAEAAVRRGIGELDGRISRLSSAASVSSGGLGNADVAMLRACVAAKRTELRDLRRTVEAA